MSKEGEKTIIVGDELREVADELTEAVVRDEDGKKSKLRLAGMIGFTKEESKKIARRNGGSLPII